MKEEYIQIMEEYQDMPLRDVVFHTLRKSILRGHLKPDERLMEIKLSEELGVSRTPIREAIRMLQLEGLVVNVPRKGTTVAKITEKDLKEVLELREGLENFAVGLAAERITEDQIKVLYENAKVFEEQVRNNKTDDAEYILELAKTDEKFHALICEATGNSRLVQMMNNISDQIYRYRVEYLRDGESRKKLSKEHIELCESLKNKNADRAVELMSRHIEKQKEHILSSVVGKID